MAMPTRMGTEIQELALQADIRARNGGRLHGDEPPAPAVVGSTQKLEPVVAVGKVNGASEIGKVSPEDWKKTLEALEADIDSEPGLRERLNAIARKEGRSR